MENTKTTFLYGPSVTKRFKRTLILDLTASQEHLVVERGSSLARGSVIVTTCAREMIASSKAGDKLDHIIVTGSGADPTQHPDLRAVTDNLRMLRDKWFSRAKLCIATSAVDFEDETLRASLAKYDRIFLQYMWGTAKTFAKMTGAKPTLLGELTKRLPSFDHVVVEATFVSGGANNAADSEVANWIKKLQEISPQEVHILSGTAGQPKPAKAVPPKRRQKIAEEVTEKTGLTVVLHDEEPLLA
ncbi:MAG: hypothetical protein OSB57_05515 [Planctomycetota bacterium]|nr:hypothetical protein [Planctomycetota bacterium]